MSVTRRIIQVVQTSPPQTWRTLWSGDYLARFVSGGGGFNLCYVIVSFIENILLLSQRSHFFSSSSRIETIVGFACAKGMWQGSGVGSETICYGGGKGGRIPAVASEYAVL